MKIEKITNTILGIALTLFFMLQIPECLSQTLISGEVQSTLNNSDNKIIIGYHRVFSYLEDTLKLNKDNRFSKSYNISEPIYIRISTGNKFTPFMLLLPGEDLYIKFIGDDLQLSGSASVYNSFLLKLIKMRDGLNGIEDQNTAMQNALEQTEAFFKTFNHKDAEKIKALTKIYLIDDLKLNPLLIKYNNDTDKMKILKSIIQGKPLPIENENLWLYYDMVNFVNENNKYNNGYLNTLNNLIRILRFHAVANDSTLNETDAYLIEKEIIKSTFTSSSLRTALLAYNLHLRIASYTDFPAQLGSVDKFIAEFKKEDYNDVEFINEISKKYIEAKISFGSLAIGAKAPLFKLNDINGRLVSLSDFKGQVVYIDIWASWCGPCLKEMPHLETLKEKYKSKNLKIISISIDTDREAWKKKIAAYQLTGIQLIDHIGSEKSKIARDYQLSGVPHFVLINKQGKIVLASAPLPSDNAILEKEIDKLLE